MENQNPSSHAREKDFGDRPERVKATIQAFVDLVMIQKFADIPAWVDFDLTVSQVRTIYFLAAQGQLTVSDLARLLEIRKPAASVLVQELVERQMVERMEDPLDRRRTWIHLTGKGRALVSGRREQRESKFQGWLAQLSDAELACLFQGVTALLSVVQRSQ